MSETNGHVRLLDHQGRRPSKAEAEAKTVAAIELIAKQAAAAQVTEVVEFYMAQIPGLVATMLAKAFADNGLTLKPPIPQEAPPSIEGEPAS